MSDSNPAMIDQASIEDPEEYNRRQRFQEIHDARQRVVDKLSEDEELHQGVRGKVPASTANRMATLVALYVIELSPLVRQLDDGLAYGEDRFTDRMHTNNLGHFAMAMGMTDVSGTYAEPPGMIETMRVFSVANQAYAELGMDLDLADGDTDASFDYSDLLEDDQQSPPEIPPER